MNKRRTQHRHLPACTTMIVGKKVSADGSVIVAHSDDDVSDERVIFVPGGKTKGSKRPVYYDNCSLGWNKAYNSTDVRRYVGKSRGPGYETRDYKPSKKLGEIPQVKSTYAYFDGNYGIMNEKGLMLGECTCGAKVHPQPEPGRRIFYSAELGRVALERCVRAREAIELMGKLIAEFGYYGTGETLLVGDKDEGWVMEMCGYDEDGSDGIWVAQRVPDDGLFVEANEFRIRVVPDELRRPPHRNDTMMCSANLFDVCAAKGWWKEGTELDWLKAVSWGEYAHPYYSLRRVWRVLSRAAPSANLSPWVEDGYTTEYPFAIKPDRKLSVADVAALYRDHYEGTEFDLTQGLAAGPFGNPARYEKNPDHGDFFNLNTYHPKGAWERPVSIYRCGMLWINQANASLPRRLRGVSWIGLDRPAANCLMPFFTTVTELPPAMETMNILKFRRKSAWWAFNFVANYATIKYCYMMNDIRKLQHDLEEAAYRWVAAVPHDASRRDLTKLCARHCERVRRRWWRLSEKLIVKYNDGCITSEHPEDIMHQVGYSRRTWLRDVGYYEGPTEY